MATSDSVLTKATCPSCKKSIRANADLAGKTLVCPGCSFQFTVPKRSSESDLIEPSDQPSGSHPIEDSALIKPQKQPFESKNRIGGILKTAAQFISFLSIVVVSSLYIFDRYETAIDKSKIKSCQDAMDIEYFKFSKQRKLYNELLSLCSEAHVNMMDADDLERKKFYEENYNKGLKLQREHLNEMKKTWAQVKPAIAIIKELKRRHPEWNLPNTAYIIEESKSIGLEND
ncbi:MAG: hypothetical protein U0798_15100 [Gemmataceae bacterium]